jgi:hypothetical protein
VGYAELRGLVNKHSVIWMEGTTVRIFKSTQGIEPATLEVDKARARARARKEEHTTWHVYYSTTLRAMLF